MTETSTSRRCTARSRIAVAMLTGLFALGAGATHAADKPEGLPSTLAWSAYDVGSGGYNQSVAIGNAFKQRYGVNLRVLPGKNDVSRMLPLRAGQVQFSVNGIGTYLSQEGVFEFGARQWGPQPIRALLLNKSDALLAMVAAKDSGVKTIADLKGKRVAWVIGAPSINQNITALLAFANLTWDDVKRVDFGGFGASLDGVINGQADAAFASSISGKTYQLAKSPRGIVYPVIPADDKAGWKRINATAPFFFPFLGTEGAEIDKDHPVQSSTYPYPILMTYAKQDDQSVYVITKAMMESYDDYKNAAPGNIGWALDRQNFEWVVPFHDGAIRYFKEKGAWKPEFQAHNDKLIQRQKVLADAWKEVTDSNPEGEEAFQKAWMKTRTDSLKRAGLDAVIDAWE